MTLNNDTKDGWAEVERKAREFDDVVSQRNRFMNERDDIVDGVKRDLQAVLDHPEWSLARIRMHLEAIINERL